MKGVIVAIASLIIYLAILALVVVAILLCLSKTSNGTEIRTIGHRQPMRQNVQNVGIQVEHYMWYNDITGEFGWHETGSGPELKPIGMSVPCDPCGIQYEHWMRWDPGCRDLICGHVVPSGLGQESCGVQYEYNIFFAPSNTNLVSGILDGTHDKPYMPTVPLDDEFIIKKCVGPGLHVDPNSYLHPESPFCPNDGGCWDKYYKVLPNVDLLFIDPKFIMTLLEEALRNGFKSISTDTLVDKSFKDFAMGRCADLDII